MRREDRVPAVAGMFYPDDPARLARAVERCLEHGRATAPQAAAAPIIVVPHAGYRYSGEVAGTAIAAAGTRPERVVMLGPAHRVGFEGVSASGFGNYRSPIGDLPVDLDAVERLHAAGLARFVRAAEVPEHCLEVMVPFLIATLGKVPIVPLLAGHEPRSAAGEDELDAILEEVVRPGDLLLCSTDLSHFLSYAVARERDLGTLRAVEEGRAAAIGPEDACGHRGLAATMRLAARRGLTGKVLEYRSSGDTGGDRDRVVGYGAVAFR